MPLALRNTLPISLQDLLGGTLDALDCGVLVTDLDHVSLACNSAFGSIFRVAPHKVVQSDVESVRENVLPLIRDRDGWLENLKTVYASPDARQRDSLSMIHKGNPVQRYTAPLVVPGSGIIGRVWTFSPVGPLSTTAITYGVLDVDVARRSAYCGQTLLSLTKSEFELLRCLAEAQGEAVSREDLFRLVWGYDMKSNSNSLDVYISRLRKKLSVCDGTVTIDTVHSFGYRLRSHEQV